MSWLENPPFADGFPMKKIFHHHVEGIFQPRFSVNLVPCQAPWVLVCRRWPRMLSPSWSRCHADGEQKRGFCSDRGKQQELPSFGKIVNKLSLFWNHQLWLPAAHFGNFLEDGASKNSTGWSWYFLRNGHKFWQSVFHGCFLQCFWSSQVLPFHSPLTNSISIKKQMASCVRSPNCGNHHHTNITFSADKPIGFGFVLSGDLQGRRCGRTVRGCRGATGRSGDLPR